MNQHSERPFDTTAGGALWSRGSALRTSEQAKGQYLRLDQEGVATEPHFGLEERREERTHIARELHDTLFQGFLGASLLVHAAVDQLPADSPNRSPLSDALRVMYRVIDEGRAAIEGLRSPRSACTSLEQALCALGGDLEFGNARFRVFVSGKPKMLRPETQEQIYMIAREAVSNSLRHSNATSIEAQVEYLPDKVQVTLRDNGSGIDPKVLRLGRNSHWGLLGMRERATETGARLTIRSRRGAGTEVQITVAADEADSPRHV